MTELPKRGHRLRLDGDLVTIEHVSASDTGADLIVRRPDGTLVDRTVTWEQLAAAGVPENDGQGQSPQALAGLWGRWMQYASPRLRSTALATRPLKPFAHQDEAVFDHLLPQPRLRFLLADEPGTGKTIMTGMYLVEGRRRRGRSQLLSWSLTVLGRASQDSFSAQGPSLNPWTRMISPAAAVVRWK